ncbi:hypothetical protein Cgig2_025861 [Carnegiea gigantea]|uniref:Uncharacterized protein n=1 Tax=Carnegiea gigantea TaxID=171969 RepID=A0A9Q1JSZ2_9CARY|nr:hypothetical protein Cgig2_025861 [Carnegiea gigantea]
MSADGHGSLVRAELRAVLRRLLLAKERDFRKLRVNVDSAIVVGLLQGTPYPRFMAELMPAAEDNIGDVTRESLIAISYSLPDKDATTSPELPEMEKTTDGDNASSEKDNEKDNNDVKDYRSELISLSYISPDVERVPKVKVSLVDQPLILANGVCQQCGLHGLKLEVNLSRLGDKSELVWAWPKSSVLQGVSPGPKVDLDWAA